MPRIAYINNKYIKFKEAKIHIEDRGLQFADSIYEVVGIYKKKLIDFDFHIKRLKFSLKELLINYTVDKNSLKKIFNKLISINKINNGIIYLQVTRGVQTREHVYNNKLKPNIIIYARHKKLNLPIKKFKGEKAVTYEDLRWKRRDIKTVNLLPNIMAANFASKHKAYEAILIQKNIVTEGTSSNIWIVKNKKIFTHPSNTDILKGVTRETLRILIQENKLQLVEKSFTKKQLFNADEVFLTSSSSCVTPITKIDSKVINSGKIGNITLNLAKLYSKSFMNE